MITCIIVEEVSTENLFHTEKIFARDLTAFKHHKSFKTAISDIKFYSITHQFQCFGHDKNIQPLRTVKLRKIADSKLQYTVTSYLVISATFVISFCA